MAVNDKRDHETIDPSGKSELSSLSGKRKSTGKVLIICLLFALVLAGIVVFLRQDPVASQMAFIIDNSHVMSDQFDNTDKHTAMRDALLDGLSGDTEVE
ncbi:MAG: hypothetical protein OEM02_13630, partial [Desulfobulbaceae bacterium]|nr:hypothetical protein [Desulfobulbaceae bacterium]